MQENAVCAANCTVQEKRGGQKIMLIRNATLQMSATERACMDVRVIDRKSTRLNSSHWLQSRMPSSA